MYFALIVKLSYIGLVDRTTLDTRAFSTAVPKVWNANQLTSYVKTHFKKTFLFHFTIVHLATARKSDCAYAKSVCVIKFYITLDHGLFLGQFMG